MQLIRYKKKLIFSEVQNKVTGNQAFFVVDADADELKRMCLEVEEESPLGRLFDIDVLDQGGRIKSRQEYGYRMRSCLVCGTEGSLCARNRTHSVEIIQMKTRLLLEKEVKETDQRTFSELACRALLYEVGTTPKPGLVDLEHNGSHRDMDCFSFFSSSAALWPYFYDCVRIGIETAKEEPKTTFWAAGFPAVEQYGLPSLKRELAHGKTLNDAGCII